MAAKSSTRVNASKSAMRATSGAKSGTRVKKSFTNDVNERGKDADSLAFNLLSETLTKEIMLLPVDQIQTKLSDTFNLVNHPFDLKEHSLLDCYVAAVWWANEQKYTAEQLSGFLTLIHKLMENIKEQHLSLVENLKELKKMLAGIGMDMCEQNGGLDFFSIEQATAIVNYVSTTLFQHYKLYEFMFTRTQAEEIIGADFDIEVAPASDVPFPPPLDEGLPKDVYNTYVAAPPPPEPGELMPGVEGELSDQSVGEIAVSEEEAHNIFAELTTQDVSEVIESITKEMLGGFEHDMAQKLRLKENEIISRINKIQKTLD